MRKELDVTCNGPQLTYNKLITMLTASHTRGVLLLGRPQLVALPCGPTSLVRPVLPFREGNGDDGHRDVHNWGLSLKRIACDGISIEKAN